MKIIFIFTMWKLWFIDPAIRNGTDKGKDTQLTLSGRVLDIDKTKDLSKHSTCLTRIFQ